MPDDLTSSRPYLVRAVHEWLSDNGLTPQLVVDCEVHGVDVPPGFSRDGQIVLNVSFGAVRDLSLANDWITFDARFGGRPHHVAVPLAAVRALVARENGAGMTFPEDTFEPPPGAQAPEPEAGPEPDPPKPRKPSLRVVK